MLLGTRLRGLPGFRAWSCLLLALALGLLGAVSAARRVGWTEPDDGAAWGEASGRVVLLETQRDGPAERAGLLPGDVLVAIDGQQVLSSIAAKSSLWEGDRNRPRSYRVLRDGQQIDRSLIPGSRSTPDAALFPYLAIVGFFFLCTGTYAAMRLPVSRLVVRFFVLCLALFALLAVSYTSRAQTWDWVLFWVDRAGGLLAPAAFVFFVSAFLDVDSTGRDRALEVQQRPRAPSLAPAFAGLAALLLAGLNLLLVSAGQAGRAADPVSLIAWKDRLERGYMAACFIGGVAMLAASSLRPSSRSHRRQLRWMLWGTALGIGPATIFYLVPIALHIEPASWAPLTLLPIVTLPLAFTAALLRYRLSDLELFLRRGFAFLSVIFFTLAVYELLSILVGRIAGGWLSGTVYSRGLAALITAFLYPRLRALVRAAVDRLFYRGKYNFRRTLVSFGRELNSELDLDALVGKIENRVRQTLDLDRLALYLRDEPDGDGTERRGGWSCGFARMGQSTIGPGAIVADDGFLSRARGVSYLETEDLPSGDAAGPSLREAGLRTLFPMKVKGEVRAILAIGRRPGGEPLNSEDLEMLVALSAQAASAIEAARLLRELREKVAEVERLQQTNENILESSRVAILVIDGDGRVQNCNRELEALTDVSRSEAVGRPISQLYSLPLVREIEQMIGKASGVGAGPPRTYRSSITNRRGDKIRVNIALSRLSASAPGPDTEWKPGWVVTLDDVTEQVRLEERFLRQDRLAAIGLLASSVAHEVNTPLTGISSYAQILLEEMDPSDPRYDLLRKIEKQTARASSIANSLLNFTRGGSEAMESLDLAEVVEEALSLFEPQLRGGSIELVKRIEPGLPRVVGHRGKLQQVLLNLLLNARDAMDGEGVVRVSLGRAAGKLVLEVSDEGCGIEEEDIGRVFDPFFTTKTRGKGTGLGLSLSYNILKEHHGEISVESRPGEGATFTVELPLDRRAAASR